MKPFGVTLLFSLIVAALAAPAQTFNSQNRDIGAVAVAGSASSEMKFIGDYSSLDGVNWR